MKEISQSLILVIGIMTSVIVFAVLLMFIPIPKDNHDILLAVVSVLTSGLMSMVGYHFGSSAGSAKKTDALIAPVKTEEKQ